MDGESFLKLTPKEKIDELDMRLAQGAGTDYLMERYKVWAQTYDEDILPYAPGRPRSMLRLIMEYFKDDQDIRILDVGAGTGCVAEGLQNLGYTNIDGLDSSQEMLNVAIKKKVYNKTICNLLGAGHTLDIKDNEYDCVVIVGLFGKPTNEEAFPELIRVTKPGGLIMTVVSEAYFKESDSLDNFEPTMKNYHELGYWTWLLRKYEPQYMRGYPGVAYVFEKKKNVE